MINSSKIVNANQIPLIGGPDELLGAFVAVSGTLLPEYRATVPSLMYFNSRNDPSPRYVSYKLEIFKEKNLDSYYAFYIAGEVNTPLKCIFEEFKRLSKIVKESIAYRDGVRSGYQ